MRVLFIATVIVVLMVEFATAQNAHRRLRSVLAAIFDTALPAPSDRTQRAACEGCTRTIDDTANRIPKSTYTVTEEEFTALRIEYIKNQILKKLRLKKKPDIKGAFLPKVVAENKILLPKIHEQHEESTYYDDFYGKTTQAIIFPYEDEARCVRKSRFPSACLPFQMPSDIQASDVSTAELWFHKIQDQFDEHNQTFVISEVAHWDNNKSFQKTKPIAIHETNITAGWLKVDVAYVIRNWLEYQDSPTHAINIVCKTCGMDRANSPVSFRSNLKPYLVIYTHSQRRSQLRRQKRYHDCTPGLHECCRESLYVSFADIGWDDWIIQPQGYNAYFCKGSCSAAASLTLSATQHNNILQKVMYGNKSSPTRLELTPCCAATQFQPLQLFYMTNNKTITSKVLSNMIVESCGCM